MNSEKKTLSIGERINSPTPKFFKKLRKFGLLAGAIGGAVLAAPISLPTAIVSAAAYLVTAGLVASAVSSATVEDKKE